MTHRPQHRRCLRASCTANRSGARCRNPCASTAAADRARTSRKRGRPARSPAGSRSNCAGCLRESAGSGRRRIPDPSPSASPHGRRTRRRNRACRRRPRSTESQKSHPTTSAGGESVSPSGTSGTPAPAQTRHGQGAGCKPERFLPLNKDGTATSPQPPQSAIPPAPLDNGCVRPLPLRSVLQRACAPLH